MTIYLIYPSRASEISTPWAIGNAIIEEIKKRDLYMCPHVFDWDESAWIEPMVGDILVGHPHPEEKKAFRESLKSPRWAKKIAVFPWAGAPKDVEFVESFVGQVDHCVVICGPYWWEHFARRWPSVSASFIDLGVDVLTHPVIKREPSTRSIAYIGCCTPEKGTLYLEKIIEAMPDVRFGHFGYGQVAGAEEFGRADFRPGADGLKRLAEFDFVINCGMHDANPTPVIEAAAWGLISMATPQCGWASDVTWHFPLDNVEEAVRKIRSFISLPEVSLLARKAEVFSVLPKYSWPNVLRPLMRAIEG